MLALMPMIASADPILIDGIYYNLDYMSETAEVTNFANADIIPGMYEEFGPDTYSDAGEIVIPSTVYYQGGSYHVTSIRDHAFSGFAGIQSVFIPYSVTSIGECAFFCCSVTSVIIDMQECIPIPEYCFGDIWNKCTLSVPQGKTEEYIENGWTTDIFKGGIKEHVSTWGGATMKYGAVVPQRLYNMTEGASIQGTPSISTNATSFSPVGAYPIRVSQGTATAGGLDMYFYDGILTIEKAPLKVTAKSYTIKQGDPLPTFEATYSGFKNKQTVSVLKELPTISCTAANTAVPGVYDIEVSGGDAENYAFTYVKGKLTIEDGGCEAYANLSNGVLTFCFDAQKSSRTGKTYTLNTGDKAPAWINDLSGVTKVVFDNAFAQVRPISTYRWFDGADKLETIEGIGNLNTSEVTNMANMFQKCRLVESLDLSGWNTAKVTNMANMFATCTKLGSLDLSGFDTQEVTNMTNMFSGCTTLTSLDLSGWNTKKVTRMNGMFATCSALTALDVKHFDTQNVTNMSRMFYNCKKLPKVSINTWNTQKVTTMKELFAGCSKMTSVNMQGMNTRKVKDMSYMFSGCSSLEAVMLLDCETFAATDMNHMFAGCTSITRLALNSFDTFSVTDMSYMFTNCTHLKAIHVCEYWDTESVSNSESMFENCTQLKGGQGTTYDDGYTDKDYARLDGGTNTPGYLTGKAEVYAVVEYVHSYFDDYQLEHRVYNLNLYFDEKKIERGGREDTNPDYYDLDEDGIMECTGIWGLDFGVTSTDELDKVVINPSFAAALPTSTECWFWTAKEIEGLQYLNTSQVTNMSNMFYSCQNLTSLDVSNFDTSNVTNMSGMFSGCSGLTSLDVSNFDTSNVTNMSGMFSYYRGQTSLDLSSLDTSNVTDMSGMFFYYGGQTSLDLSNLNTSNVTDMSGMFGYCNMKSLDLNGFDTSNVTNMGDMFQNCSGLTNLDVSSFNTSNVTNMSGMFSGCSGLTNLDLSSFNTSNVMNMSGMFNNCSGLTSLDLSNFDTSSVKYMGGYIQVSLTSWRFLAGMFQNCSGLTSLDLSSFDTSNVTRMEYMFSGCCGLTSLNLSSFDMSSLTSTPDNFDMSIRSCYRFLSDCDALMNLHLGNASTGIRSELSNLKSLTSVHLYYSNINASESLSGLLKDLTKLTTVEIKGHDNGSLYDLSSVFEGCTALKTVDLADFDMNALTNTNRMFAGCRRLQTIYSNQTLTAENSEGMFDECVRLTGGEGTALDDDHLDASYARVDGGNSTPGYFTAKAVPYMMMNDAEMTFYYDGQNFSRQEDGYKKYAVLDTPSWSNDANLSFVKNVTFDASFAYYQPTTTASWFAGANNAKTITGLENLQTSSVESMKGMFEDCYSVTTLGLSGFSTDNVTDMTDLFKNCYSLTALDLSDWTLTNVTPLESLRDCINLKTLTMQNVWMPQNMEKMFRDFTTLTTLDLSGCHTENVTSTYQLFFGCKALTSLKLDNWDTGNVTNMASTFYGCSSLKSLNLESFNTQNATGMISMFYGCKKLQTLTFGNNWKTDKVKGMKTMFANCSALQELDLSGWNLGKVTTTEKMFSGCSSLERILCDDTWDASKVGTSTSMFAGCTSLRGGKGTVYDPAYINKAYARIDGGSSAPGYMTDINDVGLVTNIKTVDGNTIQKGIYTLDGRKLNERPTKKGVYIIDGRKVVIK